jgi:hypothetical protein
MTTLFCIFSPQVIWLNAAEVGRGMSDLGAKSVPTDDERARPLGKNSPEKG